MARRHKIESRRVHRDAAGARPERVRRRAAGLQATGPPILAGSRPSKACGVEFRERGRRRPRRRRVIDGPPRGRSGAEALAVTVEIAPLRAASTAFRLRRARLAGDDRAAADELQTAGARRSRARRVTWLILLPIRGREHALILGHFRHPGTVGTVAPAAHGWRAMVRVLEPGRPQVVVELGPGTGAFTEAILERLRPGDRLLAVELEPAFVNQLRDRFPSLDCACASATELVELARARNFQAVDHIVSGLPFASLPAATSRQVLDAIQRVLRSGGTFTTFQYLHAFTLLASRGLRRAVDDDSADRRRARVGIFGPLAPRPVGGFAHRAGQFCPRARSAPCSKGQPALARLQGHPAATRMRERPRPRRTRPTLARRRPRRPWPSASVGAAPQPAPSARRASVLRTSRLD